MERSVLIITGQSGSGKSTAMRTLEDQGFFCVDNVPASLALQLVDTVFAAPDLRRLALAMDIRERHFLEQAPALVAQLRRAGHAVRVVFLEASEAVMVRRYSETRRLHPLDRGRGLRAALKKERSLLEPLRELADQTLDTSQMSPHALRQRVAEQLAGVGPKDLLRVNLLSFGFKHGVPMEADIVLDVRFLPNPYFVDGMREQTGKDAPVSDFVLRQPEAETFLQHTMGLLLFLLPQYRREGKFYLTIAIGCTGGRHRSVALIREIGARLANAGFDSSTTHRNVNDLR
jgi:UPF0042 nucleotide-binding protein